MTTINLGNIGCEKQAKKLVEKLSGQTYMNFIVNFSAYAGNYPVSVSTEYEHVTKKQLRKMVLFVLALEL